MEKIVLDRIMKMLRTADDDDDSVLPPTDLYNEGWMLRLILSMQFESIDCLPFPFLHKSRWFSEAKLYSPFLARFRGDKLAEKHTQSDGVVGHFSFHPDTKRGLELTNDSTQFVVIEAKMFSPLSKTVTNVKEWGYDQVARTAACMAWTISQATKSADDFDSLAFYVIAPKGKITRDTFTSKMNKLKIEEKVKRRISEYDKDRDKHKKLEKWCQDTFLPVLNRLEIQGISWDDVITKTNNPSIRDFYDRCYELGKEKRRRKST